MGLRERPRPAYSKDSSPSLECPHIIYSESEPLVFQSLVCESSVPISLNPSRVISFNYMDRFDFFGKLDTDFSLSPKPIVGATDLVLSTRTVPHQIDKRGLNLRSSFFLNSSLLLGTNECVTQAPSPLDILPAHGKTQEVVGRVPASSRYDS